MMFHRMTPPRRARNWRLAAVLIATVGAAAAVSAPTHASSATSVVGAQPSVSAPAAGDWSNVKWTILDDRAKKLVYSAGWTQYNDLTPQQSGTSTSTNVKGSTVTITCTCTAFRFDSVKGPALGGTEVRIDGVLTATPLGYAIAKATASTVIWRSSVMLPYGPHTLTLSALFDWTEIDAIGIGVYQDPDCPGLIGQAATTFIDSGKWSLSKIHDGVTDPSQGGFHSYLQPSATPRACVQLDLGSVQMVSGVTLYPAHAPGYTPGTSFAFPLSLRVEVARSADFDDAVVIASRVETPTDQSTLVDAPRVITLAAKQPVRYVRVIADELGKTSATTYALALAEVRVGTSPAIPDTQAYVTTQGSSFSQQLQATGTPRPYFQVDAVGARMLDESNLRLDSSTGMLIGRPSAPRSEYYNTLKFPVTVTNEYGSATGWVTITIKA
jgi:hypothetical protein